MILGGNGQIVLREWTIGIEEDGQIVLRKWMIDIVGDGQIVLREWTIDSSGDGQREWTLYLGDGETVFK